MRSTREVTTKWRRGGTTRQSGGGWGESSSTCPSSTAWRTSCSPSLSSTPAAGWCTATPSSLLSTSRSQSSPPRTSSCSSFQVAIQQNTPTFWNFILVVFFTVVGLLQFKLFVLYNKRGHPWSRLLANEDSAAREEEKKEKTSDGLIIPHLMAWDYGITIVLVLITLYYFIIWLQLFM